MTFRQEGHSNDSFKITFKFSFSFNSLFTFYIYILGYKVQYDHINHRHRMRIVSFHDLQEICMMQLPVVHVTREIFQMFLIEVNDDEHTKYVHIIIYNGWKRMFQTIVDKWINILLQ